MQIHGKWNIVYLCALRIATHLSLLLNWVIGFVFAFALNPIKNNLVFVHCRHCEENWKCQSKMRNTLYDWQSLVSFPNLMTWICNNGEWIKMSVVFVQLPGLICIWFIGFYFLSFWKSFGTCIQFNLPKWTVFFLLVSDKTISFSAYFSIWFVMSFVRYVII